MLCLVMLCGGVLRGQAFTRRRWAFSRIYPLAEGAICFAQASIEDEVLSVHCTYTYMEPV
jgi:hypothetical protein